MRDVPVTFEYVLKRRKTRPRLGEPLARELAAYSQAIAQMAERREGVSRIARNRAARRGPITPSRAARG